MIIYDKAGKGRISLFEIVKASPYTYKIIHLPSGLSFGGRFYKRAQASFLCKEIVNKGGLAWSKTTAREILGLIDSRLVDYVLYYHLREESPVEFDQWIRENSDISSETSAQQSIYSEVGNLSLGWIFGS